MKALAEFPAVRRVFDMCGLAHVFNVDGDAHPV